MKRMIEAARLTAVLYLKTGKVVMPGIALVTFLVTFYSVGPVDLVSSSALTALALALVMAWAGLSFSRAEVPVVSQLLQLNLDNSLREAGFRTLLLLSFGAAATLLSAAWPLAKNLASAGTFFTREITAAEIAGMLALFFSASVMGGAYGSLFHPRIFRDTRAAWLLALAGCLMGTFSGVISQRIPGFSYAAPLLPPLYGIIARFDKAQSFEAVSMTRTLAACWIYAAAVVALQSLLLRRIRY